MLCYVVVKTWRLEERFYLPFYLGGLVVKAEKGSYRKYICSSLPNTRWPAARRRSSSSCATLKEVRTVAGGNLFAHQRPRRVPSFFQT